MHVGPHGHVGVMLDPTDWVIKSGRYHDPTIWNSGSVPGPDDTPYIGGDFEVVIDAPVVADNFCVDGRVKVADKSSLACRWSCWCRGARMRHTEPGIEFTYIQRDLPLLDEDVEKTGNGIWIEDDAGWYLMGETHQSWITIVGGAVAGSSVITLLMPMFGLQGMRIVIPDTGIPGAADEERTVTGISSDGFSIKLNAPLAYSHAGYFDADASRHYYPRLMLLDYSIRFTSENPGGMRGHLRSTGNSWFDLQYVSVEDWGRVEMDTPNDGTVFGVYPVHRHHARLVNRPADCTLPPGVQSRLAESCIQRSKRWAVVNHQSDELFLDSVSVYKAFGVGIVLSEDGNEKFATAKHCTVAGITGMGADYGNERKETLRNKGRGVANWAVRGDGIEYNSLCSVADCHIYSVVSSGGDEFNLSPLAPLVDAAGNPVNLATVGRTLDGRTAEVSGNVSWGCAGVKCWGLGTTSIAKQVDSGVTRRPLEWTAIRGAGVIAYASGGVDYDLTVLSDPAKPSTNKGHTWDNRLNARHEDAWLSLRVRNREFGFEVPPWFNGGTLWLDAKGCDTVIWFGMQAGNQPPPPLPSLVICRNVVKYPWGPSHKPLVWSLGAASNTANPCYWLPPRRLIVEWVEPATGVEEEIWDVFHARQKADAIVPPSRSKINIGLDPVFGSQTNQWADANRSLVKTSTITGKPVSPAPVFDRVMPIDAKPVPEWDQYGKPVPPEKASMFYVVIPESAVPQP